MIHRGSCHCGRVTVAFESNAAPEALELRECACSFCRRHGARTATDPAGRLTLTFREEDVSRYRFGLRTADYVICRHCGVYVAAVIDGFATLNVLVLDARERFTRAAVARSYDGESADERVARRRAAWTPAEMKTMKTSVP